MGEIVVKMLPYMAVSWLIGMVLYVAMLYVAKSGQNKIGVLEAIKLSSGKVLDYFILTLLVGLLFLALTAVAVSTAIAFKGPASFVIMFLSFLFFIVLGFWWIFAPFVLVEENLNPFACLGRSKRLTDNTGAISKIITLMFWLVVLSFVIGLLGEKASGIIRTFVFPFTVTPITMFYFYTLYRKVKALNK
jgi:hypothetical protein